MVSENVKISQSPGPFLAHCEKTVMGKLKEHFYREKENSISPDKFSAWEANSGWRGKRFNFAAI